MNKGNRKFTTRRLRVLLRNGWTIFKRDSAPVQAIAAVLLSVLTGIYVIYTASLVRETRRLAFMQVEPVVRIGLTDPSNTWGASVYIASDSVDTIADASVGFRIIAFDWGKAPTSPKLMMNSVFPTTPSPSWYRPWWRIGELEPGNPLHRCIGGKQEGTPLAITKDAISKLAKSPFYGPAKNPNGIVIFEIRYRRKADARQFSSNVAMLISKDILADTNAYFGIELSRLPLDTQSYLLKIAEMDRKPTSKPASGW